MTAIEIHKIKKKNKITQYETLQNRTLQQQQQTEIEKKKKLKKNINNNKTQTSHVTLVIYIN